MNCASYAPTSDSFCVIPFSGRIFFVRESTAMLTRKALRPIFHRFVCRAWPLCRECRYPFGVQTDLTILVVERDKTKAHEIIDALMDGGWNDVTVISSPSALERAVKQQNPDIILIDLANPDRDTLEHLSLVSNARGRPVAMFVDQTDAVKTQAAISAGLSAYVVNGLQKDRIKPVLETAIARFRMVTKMQSELDAAKQALSDRKTIDRAKGLLMLARKISEDEAYNLLRKTAMDQGRKVIDVATALVTAAELLQ